MRYARLCALLTVLVASAGMVALAQARPHRVVMHQGFFYKPHEFAVSGDGDFLVRDLRWHSWGGLTAVAFGRTLGRVYTCSGSWRLI